MNNSPNLYSLTPGAGETEHGHPVEQEILPPEDSDEAAAQEAFQAVFGSGTQRLYVGRPSPLTLILAIAVVVLVIVAIVAVLIGLAVLWLPVVLAGLALVAGAQVWRRLQQR